MNHSNSKNNETCAEGMGTQAPCAQLAYPSVPFQNGNSSQYQAPVGLVRGTMYPGLDLPFMNYSNQNELKGTAMHQLQAMNFAINELGLYLDTHKDDQDAIDLFNQYVEQYSQLMQQFEQRNGSLTQMASTLSGSYDWTKGPWPWEYAVNKEG